jgi:hypothetical protein
MKKETQIALAVAVIVLVVIAVALLFVFSGGSDGEVSDLPPPMPPASGGMELPSGVTPPPAPPAAPPQAPTARQPFTPRRDPFAPLPEEVAAMQADVFDPMRYFVLASPPKPPKVDLPEPFETQPRRRVAGLIIGNTVSAILEQEGELTRIVYPGDMVGEFRVAAITENGLILRRSKGNPREVRVPYEPARNISGSSGGGGEGGFRGGRGAPGIGIPGRGGGSPDL